MLLNQSNKVVKFFHRKGRKERPEGEMVKEKAKGG